MPDAPPPGTVPVVPLPRNARDSSLQLFRNRWPKQTMGKSKHNENEEAVNQQRQKLEHLARRIQRKQLDTQKVVMLMICKGAYCWNPLKLFNHHEMQGASSSSSSASAAEKKTSGDVRETTWLDIEGVRNFLESRDEGWVPLYNQHPPQVAPPAPIGAQVAAAGLAALAAAPPPALPPPALPPANAAAQHFLVHAQPPAHPPPGVAPIGAGVVNGGAAHIPAGFAFPPFQIPAAMTANNAQPLVAFHMVCLAQHGEERTFSSKLNLFWDILAGVLPLD
jgi:hypothetical protein